MGNGAVAGAGAVVTKDVPAWTIVVGNPARVLRRRFPPDVADAIDESPGGTGTAVAYAPQWRTSAPSPPKPSSKNTGRPLLPSGPDAGGHRSSPFLKHPPPEWPHVSHCARTASRPRPNPEGPVPGVRVRRVGSADRGVGRWWHLLCGGCIQGAVWRWRPSSWWAELYTACSPGATIRRWIWRCPPRLMRGRLPPLVLRLADAACSPDGAVRPGHSLQPRAGFVSPSAASGPARPGRTGAPQAVSFARLAEERLQSGEPGALGLVELAGWGCAQAALPAEAQRALQIGNHGRTEPARRPGQHRR